MRLQLIVALMLPAAVGHAQETDQVGDGRGEARVLLYDDDDATTVVTTTVDAAAVAPGHVDVGAHALVDVVSSASVDVVSAATERWTENRVEIGARVGAELAGFETSAGYTNSQENDWASHAMRVGVAKELFERNTRVSAGYALVLNDVGRASDPSFVRSVTSHMVDAGASQLLDERTRVGGSLTVQRLDGFQSSPYRFVEAGTSRLPERHPDARTRLAATVFGVRSLVGWLAARVTYRAYVDDWGVRSHTGKLRVAADLGKRWHAGLAGRVYYQGDAAFYREQYNRVLAHMTADRELSTFWDASATADVSVDLGPVSADAKVGAVHYEFKNFAPLAERLAIVVGAGVGAAW